MASILDAYEALILALIIDDEVAAECPSSGGLTVNVDVSDLAPSPAEQQVRVLPVPLVLGTVMSLSTSRSCQ